jgi:ABC-type Fe3+/spermidine/putrescine transport system ATPase subunit
VVERAVGGRATLRLPGGRLGDAATGGRSFAAGEAAVLMIRPERLEVGPNEPGPERLGLPVTCTDLVFQGALLRCALRDDTGFELIDYLEASRQQPGVRPGASLWVSWERDAARLLPPDS